MSDLAQRPTPGWLPWKSDFDPAEFDRDIAGLMLRLGIIEPASPWSRRDGRWCEVELPWPRLWKLWWLATDGRLEPMKSGSRI